jgi:DNA mismatch repair protein MSH6
MLLERLKKEDPNREHKPNNRAIVERVIDGIYTKGSYIDPDSTVYPKFAKNSKNSGYDYQELDQKYVLYFCQNEGWIGVTYFDLHTLEFCVGQFRDDSMKTKFRTLVTRIRPVEVVWESKFKSSEMIKMLKSSPIPPSFFFIPNSESLDFRDSIMIIEHYLSSESSKLPKLLSKMIDEIHEFESAVTSLGNSIKYLESLKIVEKTVALATFHEYSHDGEQNGISTLKNSKLILDAQVLEHLELFEVISSRKRTVEGSLFSFIDKWSTRFGQRLLKKWLCTPLFNEDRLNERLDAVEELVKDKKLIKAFQSEMSEIYDLERYLARIYKYSVEQDSRALYVNINMIGKLNEFYTLLSQLTLLVKKLDKLLGKRKSFDSARLVSLTTFKKCSSANKENLSTNFKKMAIDSEDQVAEDMEVDECNGILPDIKQLLIQFEQVIVWKTIGKKKIPEPIEGISHEYDQANQRVEEIK